MLSSPVLSFLRDFEVLKCYVKPRSPSHDGGVAGDQWGVLRQQPSPISVIIVLTRLFSMSPRPRCL
jgi:hypothetical protein